MTIFPVRGDVRFVDGKQTLIFTGSQKAIIWLNKIFASIHESSLPENLQKFARRSTSAPCRTISMNPGEMDAPDEDPGSDFTRSPGTRSPGASSKTPRAPHRQKSPGDSPQVSSARVAVRKSRPKPKKRPDPDSIPTDLFGLAKLTSTYSKKQRKTFLRGKRRVPTSPLDSTFSSRAKSTERVTSKREPSSTASSPTKRKHAQSPPPTTPNSILTAGNASQLQVTTPRRQKSRERHPTPISPENKSESPTLSSPPASPMARKSPGLYSKDGSGFGDTPSSRQSLRSEPGSMPGSMPRTASTTPYSVMGRSSGSRPSSASSRSTPVLTTAAAAAFIRKYGGSRDGSSPSSRLFAIPEMLLHGGGSQRATAPSQTLPPERGSREYLEFGEPRSSPRISPRGSSYGQTQQSKNSKAWDYTAETILFSGISELDQNTVESAPNACQTISKDYQNAAILGDQDTATPAEDLVRDGQFHIQAPECRDPSSPPVVTARIGTPISPDFLRSMKDEETWRQMQQSPQLTTVRTKKFFKNPLFNKKAFEKKKSFSQSALHGLAYPDITESTFKQLSFATKKFMAKMMKPYETRETPYLQV